MKALILDDSKTVRDILGQILTALGFAVCEGANGLEGIEVLAHDPVDVAFVDWDMPVMDGIEFVREIRKAPGLSGIPMIMVTKQTRRSDVECALEAGADEYIMKPFNREMVIDKLSILGLIVGESSAE